MDLTHDHAVPCYGPSLNKTTKKTTKTTTPGKGGCQGWTQPGHPTTNGTFLPSLSDVLTLTSIGSSAIKTSHGQLFCDVNEVFAYLICQFPWGCKNQYLGGKKKLNWIHSIMQYLFLNTFGIHRKVHLILTSIFKTSIMCFVICCVSGRIVKYSSWQTYNEKIMTLPSEEK